MPIEAAALHHLVTGALYLQQLQLLADAALAWLVNNPDEALATASGLLGAFLLARKGKAAAYGWIAFLASNAAWLWFAWRAGHPGLFVQQIGFSITSCMGVWIWLLFPRSSAEALRLERYRLHLREYRKWLSEFPDIARVLDNLEAHAEGQEPLNAGTVTGSEHCTVSGLRDQVRRIRLANGVLNARTGEIQHD
jgi:hypothetical protein